MTIRALKKYRCISQSSVNYVISKWSVLSTASTYSLYSLVIPLPHLQNRLSISKLTASFSILQVDRYIQQLLVRLGRIDDAFHFRLMVNAGYVSVSHCYFVAVSHALPTLTPVSMPSVTRQNYKSAISQIVSPDAIIVPSKGCAKL